MNDQTKTNEKLIKELQKLRKEHDALRTAYENEVSDCKRTKDDLRRQEKRFRLMVDYSSDILVFLDKEGYQQYISPSAELITGFPVEELKKSFTEVIHPDDVDRVRKAFEELVNHPDSILRGEYRHIHKDGGFRYFEAVGRNYLDDPNVQRLVVNIRDITERKLAEEDLRATKQKFTDIVTYLDEAYFSCTLDGVLLEHNMAFKRIFGFDPDQDMKGVRVPDLWQNPQERSKYTDMLMNEGFIRNYLVDTRTISGEKTVVMVNSHLVKNENGNVVRIEGTLTDFTELKRAEDAMRESQAKYQAIFENTGTIMLIVEEDTTINMANNKCYSVTGYTPAELIGQKWIQYVAPESLQEMLKNHQLRRQNPGLAPQKYEVKLVNKKGERRDAILDISMINNTKLSVVSILDITESKQAVEALRESEERYRIFINATRYMVFLKDDKRKYLLVNEALANFFGTEMGEIIGKSDFDLMPEKAAETCHATDEQALRSDSVVVGEELVGDKIYETYKFKVPFRNGRYGIGGYIRDITERREDERQLIKQAEELRKLNATKDKFFSIIAHDLRSPFNSFLGLTQMMAEELPTMTLEQIQKIAFTMRKSATNLYSLLDNLLEWSMVQRGVTTFIPAALFLMPKISESTALAKESAAKKEIGLSYDIPEDLAVFADENMFGSIMRNLATNAVKFTPKGGNITIAAKPVSDSSVEISVKDTGIGINQEMVESLFKLDIDTNRKGTSGEPSTGLGLIICKEFVEKHGGKIWLESEEGKGSTFYFTVPAKASN